MSLTQGVSISEMVNQSIEVLTKPGVATFEQYERRGTVANAAIYVALVSLVSGLLGLPGGIGGLIANVINTLIGFFVFTGIVYYVGQQQGGTGRFDEVAYTFSLFWGPLSLIFALIALVLTVTIIGLVFLPVLGLVAIAVNIYFAYLAVQSSMNLTDQGKIWITLIAAGIGALLVGILIQLIAR